MTLRQFAIAYGVVFLLVGVLGFLPGITAPHTHPDVRVETNLGLLLGLFPVNLLHNAAHLLFGVWGLLAARTAAGARAYARVVAVAYGLLAVMGLIPAMNIHTTFGLVPLYGHDIWLHLLLALGGAYFGFIRRADDTVTAR